MFVTSKFKNVAPKIPKREQTIQHVKISELCNESISCGDDYSAYCAEGNSIGVIKHGEYTVYSTLHGHGAFVRSLQFSPFKRNQLASCSSDNTIKIWEEKANSFTNILTLTTTDPVTHLQYHPIAEHLLTTAQTNTIVLYDLSSSQQCCEMRVPATFISWSYDGSLVCATAKDGTVRVCDVRSGTVVSESEIFLKNRDISHCWIGVDKVLIGGFDPHNKERFFTVRNINNLSESLSMEGNGMGCGSTSCLYDDDTGTSVLFCKGDAMYKLAEISPGGGITVNSVIRTAEPLKGAAFVPKLSLDVMNGEVNRLVITNHNSIHPTPLMVLRKSYSEFHFDLFPDTRGPVAPLLCSEWVLGGSKYRELVSCNPALRDQDGQKLNEVEQEGIVEPIEENEQHVKILSKFTEGHSVYKNIKGELSHKNYHFHGLKNVQTVFPPETNGFDISDKYAAFLVTGAGGRLGIVDLSKPGDNNTVVTEIVNSGIPLCLQWDPFDSDIIAVGGDDAMIKLWKIDGEKHSVQLTLKGHYTKVQFLKYHPGVKDVLVSYASDSVMNVWNCTSGQIIKTWNCNDIVALNWNMMTGYDLLSVDKSGNVVSRSVFENRSSSELLNLDGKVIRNARLDCTRDLVIISTLLSGNNRFLFLLSHDKSVLKKLDFISFGLGTSILVPFTDHDLNISYLAARGECLVLPHEFRLTEPHIIPLATFSVTPVQYALAKQNTRDVMKIETARFYKLCKDDIQLITFSVPRVKADCFQDDIFQLSIDTSKPILTVEQYTSGSEYKVPMVDLCPPGVERFSEIEVVKAASQKSYIQQQHLKYKSAEKERDEIFNSFAERATKDAGPLEQELMEGCDEEEWSD